MHEGSSLLPILDTIRMNFVKRYEKTDSESSTSAQETSGSTSASTGTDTDSSSGDSADIGRNPIPCNWHVDNDECGAELYCDAPNCQTGTYRPRSSNDFAQKDPVCGGDDINYWNKSVAMRHGMTIDHTGPCDSPKGCRGITGETRPAPTYSEVQNTNESACSLDISS